MKKFGSRIQVYFEPSQKPLLFFKVNMTNLVQLLL